MREEKKIDDGGPAFPRNVHSMADNGGFPVTGLSKREWFAGMALFGVMLADIERAKNGHLPIPEKAESDLADTCYRIADAMIAEGKK